MCPQPNSESGRFDLAIDASSANIGGGVSRVQELVTTLPLLAPDSKFLFSVRRQVRLPTDMRANVHIVHPPSFYAHRQVWQHFLLPSFIEQAGARWLLSPFNVLPLTDNARKGHSRAVIVSNIAPFAQEILKDLPADQRLRLRAVGSLTIKSIRKADLTFFLSREAFRRVGQHAVPERVRFLPMAPPAPEIIEAALKLEVVPGDAAARPFFVVTGELFPFRGVEDAIRAVARLNKAGNDVRLMVCGRASDPAHLRSLGSLSEKLASGSVSFLGALGRVETLSLMSRSAATLVCSRIENPSRIPTEAMAVRSPLIVTDIAVFRETCGTAALFYPGGDSTALAERMEAVLRPEIRQGLLAAGADKLSSLDWLSASRALLADMGLSN